MLVPISVVIPCYRCSTTIKRSIDSICQQTQRPVEVVLVDDASGDETIVVLHELAKQYAGWIKVISLSENKGAASARNVGWNVATQPYIAFLDADDSWHPSKLYTQYEYMCNNPNVTLCGHQSIWLSDGEAPPDILENFAVTSISGGSLLFRNAFSTPTVMLKRDIPFRYQEGRRYAEDLLLWQQVAFAGLQVVRIESPLAYIHKPLYGADGLSAQLWKMEQGELNNFLVLYQAGRINLMLYVASVFLSIVKFIRRLCVTKVKNLL